MDDQKPDAPKNFTFEPPAREATHQERKCPHCGARDFLGNNNGGCVIFTCQVCKKDFGGNLPRQYADPLKPMPVTNFNPSLNLYIHSKTQEVAESRRRVDLTPDFKRGAPIPPPGEDDDEW